MYLLFQVLFLIIIS